MSDEDVDPGDAVDAETEQAETEMQDRIDEMGEEISQQKREVEEYSDATIHEFDEKLERLETMQEEIESADTPSEEFDYGALESRYKNLRRDISHARKEGKNMFEPHNLLLDFPGKIEVAKATGTEEDYKAAKELLDEAKQRYEKAASKDVKNVRDEIEEQTEQLDATEAELSDEEVARFERKTQRRVLRQRFHEAVTPPVQFWEAIVAAWKLARHYMRGSDGTT